MKSIIFTLIGVCFILLTCYAQVLYGTTSAGGSQGGGTINRLLPATATLTVMKNFAVPGSSPQKGLLLASNGIFYGITGNGGASGYGTLFSYDTTTGIYAQLASFDISKGINTNGNLMQASNGKLYGMTAGGGTKNYGVIFSFDIAADTITKIFDFDYINGANPSGGLVQASNGKLYGMAGYGGTNSNGVIFFIDPATAAFAKLHDFDGTHGANPEGSLIQASNGKLYGTATNGGANGYGVIFSFNIANSGYTKQVDFNNTNGAFPNGSLTETLDGKLYGTTPGGGARNAGVIFSFDAASSVFQKKHDFDYNNSYAPDSKLIQVADGNLYGTSAGGVTGYGFIFSFDPATGVYADVFDFNTFNGAYPYTNFVRASNGKLYALTQAGGSVGHGVIYSYNTVSGAYDKLEDIGISKDGFTLYGSLFKALDGNLYGMTYSGGIYNKGVLFSYNPLTDTYKKLVDFDGINGANPYENNITQASDGKLYGTTSSGGDHSIGVLFSFDPITAVYTKLVDFEGIAKGAYPNGGLMQASDGKLYGVTSGGGAYGFYEFGDPGWGVLFSYDIVTHTFKKVHDFTGADGAYPNGDVIQTPNGKLYGVTSNGPINDPESKGNGGVIYSFNPADSAFKDEYILYRTSQPVKGLGMVGPLSLEPDGKMYGVTTEGGLNKGVLFSFDTSTATYIALLQFDGVNGKKPFSGLLKASDGKLYGTTSAGGIANLGTAYFYDPANAIPFHKLIDFTSFNGAVPYFTFVEDACTPIIYYKDADGDGYGSTGDTVMRCQLPAGYAVKSGDCNDTNKNVHPGAAEICGNGIDDNCNGQVDEGCSLVKINITNALVHEGDNGAKEMDFYVTLSAAASQTIMVDYHTINNTAIAPEDYTARAATLTFPPGVKKRTITIYIQGDVVSESKETFRVVLNHPVNAQVGDGSGRGTIIDNDDSSLNSGNLIIAKAGNNGQVIATAGNRALTVMPNPASNIVTVSAKGYGGNTTIQLTSLLGKLLKQMQLRGTASRQLNVSNLATGTYFLIVTDENGNCQTSKLVIVR